MYWLVRLESNENRMDNQAPLTRPLVLSKAKHCQAVLSKAKHWHAVMSEVPFKTSTPLGKILGKNLKKIKKIVIASTKVRTNVSGRIMRPPCGWRSNCSKF